MPDAHHHRIVRAWLESLTSGIIELERDWTGRHLPCFTLGKHCPTPAALRPAPGLVAGRAYGYYFNPKGEISFVLPLEHGCDIDPERDGVYLAGDFNGWQAAVGAAEWQMQPAELEGARVLAWTGEATRFLGVPGHRFKFVTGDNRWLRPPADAPNTAADEQGNVNRVLDPARTGWHLWRFTLPEPLDLAAWCRIGWADGLGGTVALAPGNFFFELKTDLPLGALVHGAETVFRLFAPRAQAVTLFLSREYEAMDAAPQFTLRRRGDLEGAAGVWELTVRRNLHGWYYWYSIAGETHESKGNGFDPEVRVLDPYAFGTVGREGPGIVLDRAWIGRADDRFQTPAWHDLVIVEAHVRDLVANAPVAATVDERRGFTGLRKWVESADFHLHHLGVNAVELQPVQEFDNATPDEYHWGYMTNNFFAPESSYSVVPEKASGVRELQSLVAAFHRRGMAVILDVVFNHVGVPAHLRFIDRLYYFEQDANGALTNWSGCGNDLRARSAMACRLIVDSCLHFIEAYGVDGFRFDLAELLGVDVLRQIETALKRVKPDVILIAEPWSFRGHIAGALRDTGWASWNDGFRDFVREYVCGRGPGERMEYFLRGSPWYFAKWPAQTINYTESHDDRTWIDMITENGNFNGFVPTANDRRRTHLMAALLFMSLGVPMLSAGQDFLRSKHGVNNTYQQGALNALDYRRRLRYLSTHAYFAEWIALRRSEVGRLLRHFTRPSEGFLQFFHAEESAALAVLYNADLSQGSPQLLFAINPTTGDATIAVGPDVAEGGAWCQLADHERFYSQTHSPGARMPVEPQLFIPPLGCALWVRGP